MRSPSPVFTSDNIIIHQIKINEGLDSNKHTCFDPALIMNKVLKW